MKLKYLIIGTFLGLCSLAKAEESALGYLQSIVKIQPDQKSLAVQIQNRFHWDIYCPLLQVKAIVKDPENYLELGETRIVLKNLYISKEAEEDSKQSFVVGQSQLKAFQKDVPTAIFYSAMVDEKLSQCTYATIESYAWFAKRNKAEELTLKTIVQSLHNPRPQELALKIGHHRKMDLSGTGISTLRGLEFFFALEKLDISQNPIVDLSALKSLKDLSTLDISETHVQSLSDLYLLKDRLRVKALGTPLKNRDELKLFQ